MLGPLLRQTRERLLGSVVGASKALLLGDGDGRFLAALLRASPALQAVAVDSSPLMLRLLARRCHFARMRVKTICALVNDLPLSPDLARFDLIVTHFFLDCLSQAEAERLASSMAERVAPGAFWLVSDFAYPVRQPWGTLGRIYLRGLYAAFRLLTSLRVTRLPDVGKALGAAGWQRLQREERLKGLLYSELWVLRGAEPRNSPGDREHEGAAQLHPSPGHPPMCDQNST